MRRRSGCPVEANAEHVVALALEPVRRLVDVVHAGDLERLAFRKLRLDAKEATIRKRAQVPHDFDRNFGIPILDRRDIAQKVVALRRIVVQPPNHLVHGRGIDVDDCLTPDDLYALDRRRRICPAAPSPTDSRRHRDARRSSASPARSSDAARASADDFEPGHGADLV